MNNKMNRIAFEPKIGNAARGSYDSDFMMCRRAMSQRKPAYLFVIPDEVSDVVYERDFVMDSTNTGNFDEIGTPN